MGPCCLQANLDRYFQQGLVTGNYSALKLTSLGETFSSPSRQQQLTSSGQNEKKKNDDKKREAREDSWSHAVFSWRALHFLTSERTRKTHRSSIIALVNTASLPTFLHTCHWVYLKGVKAETFTKALCQELLLQIKPRIYIRRKGSFTSS